MGFEGLVLSMRYELDFLRISHNYCTQALPVKQTQVLWGLSAIYCCRILYRAQTRFVSKL
jgi:hypothetical protein